MTILKMYIITMRKVSHARKKGLFFKAYAIALSDAFEKSVGRRIFIIVVNLSC